MAIPYGSHTTYGVRSRSISFPKSSSPITDMIEKEINEIKTWLPSSCNPSTGNVCDGLSTLSRLYECMNKFIGSLSSRKTDQKWAEELMDGLVVFLDVCSIIRDIVSQIKEHVRDLQCALRRRKGDSSVEKAIAQYHCFMKKIKKDVKGLIASLKQTMVVAKSDNEEVNMEVIGEVTVFVFESVLMLFVMRDSRTPNENKWSMVVSKLIQKTRVVCEVHHCHCQQPSTYGFEGLSVVLLDRCIKDESSSWSNAKCRLETMEARLERIEGGLECIFRRLIRTRASLLNIVSHC